MDKENAIQILTGSTFELAPDFGGFAFRKLKIFNNSTKAIVFVGGGADGLEIQIESLPEWPEK